jgi:hypothetical protein
VSQLWQAQRLLLLIQMLVVTTQLLLTLELVAYCCPIHFQDRDQPDPQLLIA